MLGAAALLGVAGVLAWPIIRGGDSNSDPAEAGFSLSREQTRDVAAALTAAPSEPGLSEWNSDLDWLSKKSMSSQTFVPNTKPFWHEQTPDLPLPVPQTARSEPETPRAAPVAPQPPVAREAAPEPARRAVHEAKHEAVPTEPVKPQAARPEATKPEAARPEPAHAAAARQPTPKPHRIAARPSYMEKVVEQGDAGDVKFRYRRQACTPRHMVDVCYMPAENRRNIVVERW
jgi:hypothetical protein